MLYIIARLAFQVNQQIKKETVNDRRLLETQEAKQRQQERRARLREQNQGPIIKELIDPRTSMGFVLCCLRRAGKNPSPPRYRRRTDVTNVNTNRISSLEKSHVFSKFFHIFAIIDQCIFLQKKWLPKAKGIKKE